MDDPSASVKKVLRICYDGVQKLTLKLDGDLARQLTEKPLNALQGRSRQKQPPRQEQFEPLTTAPFVSVTSRIIHVLRGLMTGRVKRLRQLFVQGGGRSQTVATFLAVLELMRAGRIAIADDESLTVRTGRKM